MNRKSSVSPRGQTGQPWIGGCAFDVSFILGPAYAITACVLCFPGFFRSHAVTPLLWAVLVVGVDVAHVYSTLYRTYFDPLEFRRRRTLYLLVPVLGFLSSAALYSLGAMVFWRALAYLAVFHFIRQQYGFMMIYRRDERRYPGIDKAAIYAATIYPLIWWHCHTRHFAWFVEGDFVSLPHPWIAEAMLPVYAAIIATYMVKEWLSWRATGHFNVPRNLLLAGTALSWWTGIVVLDSDLAFTATNVLAHGIPYMALIWLFGHNQSRDGRVPPMLGIIPPARLFSVAWVPLFIGLPVLLAYLEEGLWDGFIWTEHPTLFGLFQALPAVDNADILVWLVPLLALPQLTHYVLDAFIWRLGLPGTSWKRIMFPELATAVPDLPGPREPTFPRRGLSVGDVGEPTLKL
jgi:hypothetical protein